MKVDVGYHAVRADVAFVWSHWSVWKSLVTVFNSSTVREKIITRRR